MPFRLKTQDLFKKPRFSWILFVILGSSLCTNCAQKAKDYSSLSPEVILQWNEKILTLAEGEDGFLTLKGVRTEAMAHVAMHNALNVIQQKYTLYKYVQSESPTADPTTAISQAAFEVAQHSFPDHAPSLKQFLEKILQDIPDRKSKKEGIQLGKKTAQAIIELRNGDQWNGASDYTWHPMAPGVYAEFNEHSGTPNGFVFGAGWAAATPFLLDSPDQFRSPPPPKIRSKTYAKAFQEVKTYGHTISEVRTKDQAHLAMWWKTFVEKSHNQLARSLINKEGLNLWESARALALLNMTIYDAYVNVFNNKFHYNHWRPYTAIRWAANDENPDTEEDPKWNNLHHHTYAFPSYPSAHGTASTAAMTVLAHVLGTGNEYSFTMSSAEVESAGPFSKKIKMNVPTRSFSSFSAAGLEASMSRVYLGIHFRYDSEEGYRLGTMIGNYANRNFLKSVE